MIDTEYIVVGSGIFGSVVAERIATVLQKPVTVIEKRSHIGGNCHSAIDQATGIECHCYGSHIFHTSNEKVWKYINLFTNFTNYRHKVLTISDNQVYFMPINLKTLCDITGRAMTPTEAQKFLSSAQKDPAAATNLEEKAIALIGEELYKKFIRGYTRKQWNKDPKELPADIITRLPVRTDFNTDYFNDPYQGVPQDGYFRMFEKMLDNPRINLLLNTDFAAVRSQIKPTAKIIYSGMIDEYFDYCAGHLEWRTLQFEYETLPERDHQGSSVVNYADENVPYTRIHEFKHYHPERKIPFESNQTVSCKEYSKEWKSGDEAYYPVNTAANERLFGEYQQMSHSIPNLIFGGRLGCYRYWDMDKAVAGALECFEKEILEK